MEILKLTEREKYLRYWQLPGERIHSPGMRAIDEFIDEARQRRLHKILDVGCGMGRCVAKLAYEGFNAMGIDIADNCLEDGVRGYLQSQCRFIPAPCWNMPFEDDSYDCIFSCDVLEHVPEPLLSETVDEFARVASIAYVEIANFHREVGGMRVHMSVKPDGWWSELLEHRFEIESCVQRKPPKTGGIALWLKRKD